VARRMLIGVLGALALVACATDVSEGPEDEILAYQSDGTMPARFRLGGAIVEVHPPLVAELSIAKRKASASQAVTFDFNLDDVPADETDFESGVRVWLDGERIRVEDGELWIGERSHGAVGDALVVIDTGGVHVE